MPDISMCLNVECPSRFDCYRYMAEPKDQQDYMGFSYDESGKCDSFWMIELGHRLRKIK